MKSISKTTIVIVVVLIAIVVTYFYLEGGSTASSDSLLTQSGANVDTSMLSLLNQVKSLRIDASLFNDPVYKSLRDFTVPIPAENVGRPNPFAPIPGVANPGASSQQTAPQAPSH